MSEAKEQMVDRVARAMYMAHLEHASLWPIDWRDAAHVAIAAMREPTKAMTEAGSDADEKYQSEVLGGDLTPTLHTLPEMVWRAMIDVSLSGSSVGHQTEAAAGKFSSEVQDSQENKTAAGGASEVDTAAISDRANEERRHEPSLGPEAQT